MSLTRLSKSFASTALGAMCGVVAFNNVTDYATNFEFTRHVLSMDTNASIESLGYRSIDNPLVWHAAYDMIILSEAAASVLYLLGGLKLFLARSAPAAEFRRAKTYVLIASMLTFAIWFLGFEIIGGEWFAMWRSPHWNGQESAFRYYVTALLVLIFVSQDDRDEA